MRALLVELNAYLRELPNSPIRHEIRDARNALWMAINFGIVFTDCEVPQ